VSASHSLGGSSDTAGRSRYCSSFSISIVAVVAIRHTCESAEDGSVGHEQVVVIEHGDEARGDASDDCGAVVKYQTVDARVVGQQTRNYPAHAVSISGTAPFILGAQR